MSRSIGYTLDRKGAKYISADAGKPDFRARTMFLGSAPSPGFEGAGGDSLTWSFRAKLQRGSYDRFFSTAIGEVKQINVDRFSSWEVVLERLPSSPLNLRGLVMLSEGEADTSQPARFLSAVEYAAGTWAVPAGAVRVYSNSTNTLQWSTETLDGAQVFIPQVLAAGGDFRVKGTSFAVGAPTSLIWEVEV